MYEIYGWSAKSHIWLVESKRTTTMALQFMYKIWDEMRADTNKSKGAVEVLVSQGLRPHISTGWLSFATSPNEISAIRRFYGSKWLQRL